MVGSDCFALGSSNTVSPSDSVLPSGRDTWDVEKGEEGESVGGRGGGCEEGQEVEERVRR